MKKTRIMIFIFGLLDIIASIVYAIIWIIALTHSKFEEYYFASSLICLTNGLVFLYIANLGNRVEYLEEGVSPIKKNSLPTIKKDYSVYDKVVLTHDVVCGKSIIKAGEVGIITGRTGDDFFVKLPNSGNITCKVDQQYIKHRY